MNKGAFNSWTVSHFSPESIKAVKESAESRHLTLRGQKRRNVSPQLLNMLICMQVQKGESGWLQDINPTPTWHQIRNG